MGLRRPPPVPPTAARGRRGVRPRRPPANPADPFIGRKCVAKQIENVNSAGCGVYWPVKKGTRICLDRKMP